MLNIVTRVVLLMRVLQCSIPNQNQPNLVLKETNYWLEIEKFELLNKTLHNLARTKQGLLKRSRAFFVFESNSSVLLFPAQKHVLTLVKKYLESQNILILVNFHVKKFWVKRNFQFETFGLYRILGTNNFMYENHLGKKKLWQEKKESKKFE